MIYETKNAKKIEACVLAQIKELRYKKRKDFYEINIDILKKIYSREYMLNGTPRIMWNTMI